MKKDSQIFNSNYLKEKQKLLTPIENFEQHLKDKLFEDITPIKVKEEVAQPRPGKSEWDIKSTDTISYFDKELSYEITGYRPITKTESLDFDPDVFRQAALTKLSTGDYCTYRTGTRPYIEFWKQEHLRCKEGLSIGKYRITGDHYFFLNYYQLPFADEDSVKASEDIDMSFPKFIVAQYEFFHYIELAEYARLDVVALKSRGIGFSEIGASLGVRPFSCNTKYKTLYTAFTDAFLKGVLDKCWTQLDWLNDNTNYGMKSLRQKYDRDDKKRASWYTSDKIEKGRFSEIHGIIADIPRKIRGDRPQRLIFEEFGSNPVGLPSWVQGEALVIRGTTKTGTRIGWGCVCAGTKVDINNGNQIDIKDIKQKDGIIGFKNGELNKEPITYIQDECFKPCVRITTRYATLECSEDHPILCKRQNASKIRWVEAKNVGRPTNRWVMMPIKQGVFGKESFSDGRTIGLLMGEDTYNFDTDPHFIDCNDDIFKFISNKYEYGDIKEESLLTDSNRISQKYTIPSLTPLLKKLGLYNINRENIGLPNNFRLLTQKDAALLLSGICDRLCYKTLNQLGFYITHPSNLLLSQIQILFRKFGILSNLKNNKLYINDKRSINIFIENISLLNSKKENSFKILYKPFLNDTRTMISSRIFKVEPIGVKQVYNLTADDSHTYIANGIITHNTGGDAGKGLAALSKIFNDPRSYGVLPYKHNYTDTGEYQLTGFFVPAFRFSTDRKYIDKRGYVDEDGVKEFYKGRRRLKEGENLLLYSAEYCFTPTEALLREGENMFDSTILADRLTQLRVHKMGKKPRKVSFLWTDETKESFKVVTDESSKILVYEEPEKSEDIEYSNLYVAGIDSIDQGREDSAQDTDISEFCLVIKKRVKGLSEPKYVLVYKDRPKDIRTAYANALRILMWYNCKALIEYSKISIVSYFKERKKENLFIKRPGFAIVGKKKTSLIGVPATPAVISHGLELISNYINDYGHLIDSEDVLDQLLRYSYENKKKFDVVAAMAMAEIGDEDMMGVKPKELKQSETEKGYGVGWYTDKNGYKRFGVIPKNNGWT